MPSTVPSVPHLLIFMIDKNAYPLIKSKEGQWFSDLPNNFLLRTSANAYSAKGRKHFIADVRYAPAYGDEVPVHEMLHLFDALVASETDIAVAKMLADIFSKACPDIKFWVQSCECETFLSYKQAEYTSRADMDQQMEEVMKRMVFPRKDVCASLKRDSLSSDPTLTFAVADVGDEARALCKQFGVIWSDVDSRSNDDDNKLNAPATRALNPKLVYSYRQHLNDLLLEAVDGVNLVSTHWPKV